MNVKVKTTLDLVSAIPYLLGYQPQESVTVVCVKKNGRLGLVARSDLDRVNQHRTPVEIQPGFCHAWAVGIAPTAERKEEPAIVVGIATLAALLSIIVSMVVLYDRWNEKR